jgi:hypothetical protein
LLLEEFDGSWQPYIDAVFEVFWRDFVASKPSLNGQPVACDSRMGDDGKEEGFWHVTSEGPKNDRMPCIPRCERIRWIRFLIERVPSPAVRYWEDSRKGKRRIIVADIDFSFKVVLQPTRRGALLVTAVYVEREHERGKLRREYGEWQRKIGGAASDDTPTPSTLGR